ncbi:hypothetical protein PCANC_00831 [Puccinia coronata f. sp. avenae]|uniref:Uncharacterized protein n=1 Tax=Puccinia coronata f. sp. avenae TaxID=200324 RepID=A0A2N5W7H7_9BASI|nr:hypothetical protein PCANC_00831 [Puccinia coronata f. sp. avenae]
MGNLRAGSRQTFGDLPIKIPTKLEHPTFPRAKAVRGRSERLSGINQEERISMRKPPLNNPVRSGRRRESSDVGVDVQVASDSGWGTESEGDTLDPHKIGKQETESLLKKADSIIDHIGESWESEVSAQVEPIKADFKNLAHRIHNLMLTEAAIAQNLSDVVETSQASTRQLINGLTDKFGETLEKAVTINENIQDFQRKIQKLDERMRKRKGEFTHDLAALEARNKEEIDEFKEELARETANLPAKIQAAKSNKADQKQAQLKLAKILADGLP